jgi:G3E family GTPase
MIPVSVVTGFLGSGKTTLIGRLLRDPALAGTAVIVNEFGEVALDHDLLAHAEESVIALPSGCLCCAVRGDLAATLLDLAARRAAGALAYERVLIETSGLADPVPVVQSLIADRDVAATHAIDTVTTVIDCVHGAETLASHPEARRQAAMADCLLFSKTDLARPNATLTERLDSLNRSAPRAPASDATAVQLFAGASAADRAARLAALPPEGRDVFGARHTDGIQSTVLVRAQPVPALALTLLLQALAEHGGERLLRVKGLVEVEELPGQPALVHGVRHVFAAPTFLSDWPTEDRRTRLVLIGRAIPTHFAARLLDAIEAEVRAASAQR